MSITFLAIAVAIIVFIRALISYYIFRKFPGLVKWIGYYVLTLVTCIFIFFPTCIFLGNEVCWDFDVATHKTVLLIASAILLLLCTWTWIEIFKYPKINDDSGVPGTSRVVGIIVATVAILIALIVVILGTSSYWAPLVGQ
jgi:hypothetical protein